MTYINKNKIIGADILAPYTNCGEPWDVRSTKGWQVRIIFSTTEPDVIVDKESQEECIKLIESLGLITL